MIQKSKPYRKTGRERDIKKAIKVKLGQHPDIWYYMPVQSLYGRHGIPDFVACVPVVITPQMIGKTIGAFAAIETKRLGKVATAHQEVIHREIRKAHGIVDTIDNTESSSFLDWLLKVMRL